MMLQCNAFHDNKYFANALYNIVKIFEKSTVGHSLESSPLTVLGDTSHEMN